MVIIAEHSWNAELLAAGLNQPGLDILIAHNPEDGLGVIFKTHPQIVFSGLVMPRTSGLEILERVVAFDPAINVFLLTAHSSAETAVSSIRKGAADYLTTPLSISALRERVEKIVRDTCAPEEAAHVGIDRHYEAEEFGTIIGNSPAIRQLFARISRIAPYFRTVLITGPTGAGKQLVSQVLHKLSPASSGNLVVVNCSAIIESLFESELFGHVKGAFTGAVSDKMGLVEHAHGGTLFLDEIGDMPLGAQAKLLRTLQNQEVQRIGSLNPRKVNVRVVATTHRDLRGMVPRGPVPGRSLLPTVNGGVDNSFT